MTDSEHRLSAERKLTGYRDGFLETPTEAELMSDYVHLTKIKVFFGVLATDESVVESDFNQVIALRPGFTLRFVATNVDKHKERGYFAVGKKIDDYSGEFDIYAPKSRSKAFEAQVSEFCRRLIDAGYGIEPRGVVAVPSKLEQPVVSDVAG